MIKVLVQSLIRAVFWISFFCNCTPRSVSHLVWGELKQPQIEVSSFDEKGVSPGVRVLQATVSRGDLKIIEREHETLDKAEHTFDFLLSSVESLFEEKLSPYPNVISNTIACKDKKFLPLKLNFQTQNFWKKGFIVYANSRSAIGVCKDEEATHFLLQAVIFCPKSKITYEIKLITSLENKKSLLEIYEGFSCEL